MRIRNGASLGCVGVCSGCVRIGVMIRDMSMRIDMLRIGMSCLTTPEHTPTRPRQAPLRIRNGACLGRVGVCSGVVKHDIPIRNMSMRIDMSRIMTPILTHPEHTPTHPREAPLRIRNGASLGCVGVCSGCAPTCQHVDAHVDMRIVATTVAANV